MFILDSLMISGIRWALETAITAAEAEMNDDGALREQLLEAEMRRELREISEEEFRETETDLLARIRDIRDRRAGGSGPLAFAEATALESGDGERFNIEASLAGDFHAPSASTDGSSDDAASHGETPDVKRARRPAVVSPVRRRTRAPGAARRSPGKSRTAARTRRS